MHKVIKMQILELVQGTQEWHTHRATHFNASDAPAMMGCSSYQTRTELLDRLKTGIVPEVDAATQRRFDDGHNSEALARPLAEAIIGESLYPVTGTNGAYSASFDGLTMLELVHFEHKRLNDRIRAATTAEELPLEYLVQVEHQFMVCETSDKCLFMATRWEGEECVERREFWIYPNIKLREQIKAGWDQLEKDLLTHQPTEKSIVPVGKAPELLPALHIEVTSLVKASNLDKFAEHAIAVFSGIKTDLQTDEDFADADTTAKWCRDVEARLASTEEQILRQSQDVEAMFRVLRSIKEEARQKALTLERLVKNRKEAIKTEAVMNAKAELSRFVAEINKSFGRAWLKDPAVNFGEAIKGLKTIASLKERIGTTLAGAKADASITAERINANRLLVGSDMHLFPDFAQHCTTESGLFSALLDQRKAKHQERISTEAATNAAPVVLQQEANIAEPVVPFFGHAPAKAVNAAIPSEFGGNIDPVVLAEPRIAAFLNSREWGKGEANKVRAYLVEYEKFVSAYQPNEAA